MASTTIYELIDEWTEIGDTVNTNIIQVLGALDVVRIFVSDSTPDNADDTEGFILSGLGTRDLKLWASADTAGKIYARSNGGRIVVLTLSSETGEE